MIEHIVNGEVFELNGEKLVYLGQDAGQHLATTLEHMDSIQSNIPVKTITREEYAVAYKLTNYIVTAMYLDGDLWIEYFWLEPNYSPTFVLQAAYDKLAAMPEHQWDKTATWNDNTEIEFLSIVTTSTGKVYPAVVWSRDL